MPQSNTDRGCYAGDRCKFLHGETERLTPYDKNKPCKFYAAGYCRRGEKCWFLHADPSKVGKTSETEEEDEIVCTICYDKPETFGLLGEYSHCTYLSRYSWPDLPQHCPLSASEVPAPSTRLYARLAACECPPYGIL